MPKTLILKYPKYSRFGKPTWLKCKVISKRKYSVIVYVPKLDTEVTVRLHKFRDD